MAPKPTNQPLTSNTLVEGAISRPDEPRHFLVIEPIEGAVIARLGERILARSNRALRVREVGRRILEPVVYFPPEDVDAAALSPTEITTTCPLKGTAMTFDVIGSPAIEAGAWSYQRTHDFDRRLTQLECCVAFDRNRVSIEPVAKT